jgi:hypothetical protein
MMNFACSFFIVKEATTKRLLANVSTRSKHQAPVVDFFEITFTTGL